MRSPGCKTLPTFRTPSSAVVSVGRHGASAGLRFIDIRIIQIIPVYTGHVQTTVRGISTYAVLENRKVMLENSRLHEYYGRRQKFATCTIATKMCTSPLPSFIPLPSDHSCSLHNLGSYVHSRSPSLQHRTSTPDLFHFRSDV
jgi:hypothetical protein